MRNAVKKRMKKLRNEQRKKEVEEIDQLIKEQEVLGMVGSEIKMKYPPGSCIVFTASYMHGEKPESVSCSWYNKTGIQGENLVSNPPEWQNISMEEMEKICEMFDEHLYMPLVYREKITE